MSRDMTKMKNTKFLVSKVDDALMRFGKSLISVDLNEETGMIDINQCHHAFSDVIFEGVVSLKSISKRSLISALNKRNVGHCL